MGLIKCRVCQKEYSDDRAACIHCGAETPGFKKPMGCFGISALIVVGLVVVFFLIGFIASSSPEGKQRSKERAGIAYCESTYKKLKEDPGMSVGALSFAYATCEKMKADFRAKWNREP